jgi:hypothetical protein
MRFWQRTTKLNIGQAGGKGISLSNIAGNGLTVDFDIIKDSTTKTNKATFKIYNLSTSSSAFIAQPQSIIEFFAGWEGITSRIFLGCCLSCDDVYSGGDKITSIVATDGGKELSESVISIEEQNNTDSTKIFKDIAKQLGLSIRFGKGIDEIAYNNGYSFVGKGQDSLTEVCDSIQAQWFINNGVINIVNYNSAGSNLGYELNATTGLLGTPSHIVIDNYFKEKKDSTNSKTHTYGSRNSKNGYGYNIKCLLNPYINIRDLIHVSSKSINDYMYVESIHYRGNTNNGDFTNDIIGIRTSE